MRKKTSPIWFITKEKLIEIVKNSSTFVEILKFFELKNKGNNHKTLKQRLNTDSIDYTHIQLGQGHNKGKKFFNQPQIPLNEILIEHSTYNRGHLKKRLLKTELLKNKCSICGLDPIWNNQSLTLQIDHINGISDDHRIENLRIICPNCHSQTSSYAGRSLKKGKNKLKHIKEPKLPKIKISEIDPNWKHAPKLKLRRVERPSKEELEKMLWEKPTSELCKSFGVSGKAIEKWAKSYGITKPKRGYWQKLHAAEQRKK